MNGAIHRHVCMLLAFAMKQSFIFTVVPLPNPCVGDTPEGQKESGRHADFSFYVPQVSQSSEHLLIGLREFGAKMGRGGYLLVEHVSQSGF